MKKIIKNSFFPENDSLETFVNKSFAEIIILQLHFIFDCAIEMGIGFSVFKIIPIFLEK